jgi:phosphoglycerol transferase MdoB-like AlkP superfamily enzyme
MDFGVEFVDPAQNYQTCLPQVFRLMASATDMEEETLSLINGTTHNTTDAWETIHIAGYTGQWDHTKLFLQRAGFKTVIDAEFMERVRGQKEFVHFQGHFDEGCRRFVLTTESLPYLWDYVDGIRSRTPKNRMYLAWQSQVTHWGIPLNPEWTKDNYRPLTQDQDIDRYLNGLKETDDLVKEIILGFRARGLEDETLFIMYVRFRILT